MPITTSKKRQASKLSTTKIVEELLIGREYLRDDDERLVANVLFQYLKKEGLSPDQMTASELLSMYSKGDLPTVDYITRSRRKLQEERPELRGLKWKERQLKGCGVQLEINNLDPRLVF